MSNRRRSNRTDARYAFTALWDDWHRRCVIIIDRVMNRLNITCVWCDGTGFTTLYFGQINRLCAEQPTVIGCRLLLEPHTIRTSVRGIRLPSDAVTRLVVPRWTYKQSVDCLVIELCEPLAPDDRVTSVADSTDSFIFDLKDDQIARIEIVGASRILTH